MKMTVLIPTYCRTPDLARCLDALKHQTLLPIEVILVVRDSDEATWHFLQTYEAMPLTLKPIPVTIGGQVAALNQGLAAVQGEVVAITDDDAVPHAQWLARIAAHFSADERVGGVGGRDWVYLGDRLLEGQQERVGLLHWFGRVTGNHHLGVGTAREVDVLKGANMSYRRSAIAGLRFDDRLKGQGAQVHNDMAFSLAVKRSGWKLIYDPLVAVNHYPAQRFDEDQRGQFNPISLLNQVHNETLVLMEHLKGWRSGIFLIWALLLGTRASPGLLQGLRLMGLEGVGAWQKWWVTCRGRYQGLKTWVQAQTESQA